jgi:hypothetical protein
MYSVVNDPNSSGGKFLFGTEALGINNNNEIVGDYSSGSSIGPINVYGFLYNGSSYVTLVPPGATETEAFGVNDLGDVVGDYEVIGAQSAFIDGGIFLYNGSTYSTFHVPGVPIAPGYTHAVGINDSGIIVGTYIDSNNITQGFIKNGSQYTTLSDPLGVGGTHITGISNSGQIVGYYVNSAGSNNGFIFADGKFTTIDFPGANGTELTGINSAGQAVGTMVVPWLLQNGSSPNFIYENGSFTIINPLPAGSGSQPGSLTRTVVSGINDAGTIVGSFSLGGDSYEGFSGPLPLGPGHDFNDDGTDDFLMSNGSVLVNGECANGTTTYTTLGSYGPEWRLVGSGDFLGDGDAAGLLHSTGSGAIYAVEIVNGQQSLTQIDGLGNEWSFVGSGDFGGAGFDDFLVRNTAGALDVGAIVNGTFGFTQIGGLGSEWTFGGQNGLSADFLGDGRTDFLIHSSGNGELVAGEDINGTAAYTTLAFVGNEWSYLAAGDFLGDGHQDFLMRNTAGTLAVGEYNNGSTSFTDIGGVGSEWQFIGSGDFLGDGKTGALMHSTGSGATYELEVTNGQAKYSALTAWGNEWHAQT